jgi:hypothetical protein
VGKGELQDLLGRDLDGSLSNVVIEPAQRGGLRNLES